MAVKPLPKLVKECGNCSLLFEYKYKNRQYCSQRCSDAKRHKLSYIKRKSISGREALCSSRICENRVWLYPRHIRAGTARYCSTTCMGASMSIVPLLKCEFCGKEYYTKRANRFLRNRKFCSRTCNGAAVTKAAELRNSNNPPSRGVLNRRIRYSKRMDDWRKAVFERDDYTCTACGTRGGYLQADHIMPFAYFEHLRFELSNGRTMCKNCHAQTETFGRRAVKLYAKS